MRARTNPSGFSLVELATVIMIVGLMGAIATPVLMNWLPNKRLKAATRELSSAMMQAKSEAIRRSEQVTLAFAYKAGDHSPANAELNERQLFVLFVDNGMKPAEGDAEPVALANDAANNRGCDSGEEILLRSGPAPDRIVISENTFTTSENVLLFNERGLPVDAEGKLLDQLNKQDRGILLCVGKKDGDHIDDNNKSNCRKITVAPGGRVRTAIYKRENNSN